MKKIIWMEVLLLGSSILIFRSVWAFLDKLTWARESAGLGLLLVVGAVIAIFALVNIHSAEDVDLEKTRK